ncbi:MAG: hypothetical protein QXF52_08220 [Thermoproteota archaeon]
MRLEAAACLDLGLQTFSSLRIVFFALLLCNAAIQDVKNRELEASAWVPIILIGVSTLIVELVFSRLETILPRLALILATLSLLFLLGLYELGDALILVGIGLTHISTTKPLIKGCLLQLPFPEFSLTVLLNAELFSLIIIVLNLVHNLYSGALADVREKVLREKVLHLLFLKAVKPGVETGQSIKFVKQTVPMVLFIFLGYAATLLFGSLIPLPYN